MKSDIPNTKGNDATFLLVKSLLTIAFIISFPNKVLNISLFPTLQFSNPALILLSESYFAGDFFTISVPH